MIALDTNVLVRLIVRDDEEQLQRARGLVERAIGEEQAIHLCEVSPTIS